ncbi:MAG: hypothetical protein V1777_01025 [Candidatus Micrarchaeota archaeon]
MWQPEPFLKFVGKDIAYPVFVILFVFFAHLFVFRGSKNGGLFLYTGSAVLLASAVIAEFLYGFFSFSMNNLWEAFVALFSVFYLLKAFVLLVLIRGADLFGLEKEFEKRTSGESYSSVGFFLGAVITTILFLVLNLGRLIPNPIIGVPFVFMVDGFAEQIEKLVWIRN